ncbi:copper resistance D family protein [Bacillus songklensis]|uniref:Copper resistance D family protein n=1 Tax=Bacillus songklensis TaxID=1069116 RepID=A0ABV8B7F2_9BACI
MFYVTVVSETLLYFFFSMLIGYFILETRPATRRPIVSVPPGLLYLAVIALPVLSFFPVLRIVLFLKEQIGFWKTMDSVLWTFEAGQAWLVTAVLSLVLLMFTFIAVTQKRNELFYIALICMWFLVLTVGWSSHASSLSFWKGFIAHTFHFLAVIVWTGILLNVGFFAKKPANWSAFLKWFTPLAVGCLIVLSISGFIIMDTIVPYEQYANIWLISYGQTLLFKHLFLLPILLFAVINGLLMKKTMKESDIFSPLPWLKAEGALLFIVFALTGLLGQQSPPHELETALKTEGASPLFEEIYRGTVLPTMTVNLDVNMWSLSFGAAAVVFAFVIITAFLRKAPAAAAFIFSLLLVVACYVSLMYGVQ